MPVQNLLTRAGAVALASGLAVAAVAGAAVAHPAHARGQHAAPGKSADHRSFVLPGGYKHLVVIYEENHSFDNLYGGWGSVNGQAVNGIGSAGYAARAPQVAQDGTTFQCLLQNDVNLAPDASHPGTCSDSTHTLPTPPSTASTSTPFSSRFTNTPFKIDDYIKPADTTCPPDAPGTPFMANGWKNGTGAPGGCTRDIVHRFYQEQYQIDGGKQDRYTTGSDAVGLTQGYYDTKSLPIYKYLTGAGAPHYVIADNFFQAAFGGSFLNHQFLIAARAPLDTDPSGASTNGVATSNSVVDGNGMPTSYPLYNAQGTVKDTPLTQACAAPATNDYAKACGNYAINTIQPQSTPHGGGAQLPLIDDAKYPNIGDELSAKGISWNWYSGGWDDANNGHPGTLFQYHHQPFNYFAAYAPGQPGRAHLQDEKNFTASAQNGTLPTVSFVKPYGAENEHPGYASEPNGSDHLVDLLKTITSGPEAKSTLVVVTYDEFGGQWDHVSVPKVDAWGPGTRIPALVLSTRFEQSGVDHTEHDTTSILATIEHAFKLAPLSSRDAGVSTLDSAVRIGSGDAQ